MRWPLQVCFGRNIHTTTNVPQVDIAVDKAHMWASYAQLCAVVTIIRTGHLVLCRVEDLNEGVTQAAGLPVVSSRNPLGFELAGAVGKATVVLSTQCGSTVVPILESGVVDGRVKAARGGPLSQLTVEAELQVLANVYSSMKRGWEPLLEPWRCCCRWDVCMPRCPYHICCMA
jgi:hypothetical protein